MVSLQSLCPFPAEMIRKELQKFPGAKGKYFISFFFFLTFYLSSTFRKFAIVSVANSLNQWRRFVFRTLCQTGWRFTCSSDFRPSLLIWGSINNNCLNSYLFFVLNSEFVWSQEEHRNMGAWSFVSPRFENILGVKVREDAFNLPFTTKHLHFTFWCENSSGISARRLIISSFDWDVGLDPKNSYWWPNSTESGELKVENQAIRH